MAEAVDYKQIGTTPVRPDGFDKVTGRAQFGADVNLPNMIHGKVYAVPMPMPVLRVLTLVAPLPCPAFTRQFPGQTSPVAGWKAKQVARVAAPWMTSPRTSWRGIKCSISPCGSCRCCVDSAPS